MSNCDQRGHEWEPRRDNIREFVCSNCNAYRVDGYTHSLCRDAFGNDPGNCPCNNPKCTGYDSNAVALDTDPQGVDDSLYPVTDRDIANERAAFAAHGVQDDGDMRLRQFLRTNGRRF